ncbi:Creatinase/aminopeptidase [Amylostereum chailletii]|nr:Creatinase/aminopeptidase [Amylostereum chailletii]
MVLRLGRSGGLAPLSIARLPCALLSPGYEWINLRYLHKVVRSTRARATACVLSVVAYLGYRAADLYSYTSSPHGSLTLSLSSHCAHVPPISAAEILQRQKTLAETLHALNASAFVAEPGANTMYYANVSGSAWHLSERPLLLLIAPTVGEDGAVEAAVSVLTPAFEATRARTLPVVAKSVAYPAWAEEVDPYAVALDALPGAAGTIFADGNVRHFIVDGLQKAATEGVEVTHAPVEVRQLRERKSSAELEIMKCANEVTVLAVRAAKEEFYIGMRESEGHALVDRALSVAGLSQAYSLVMFGENAALPHGAGTDRELTPSDFVLVDCGGELHGYVSDVTRSFLLPASRPNARQLELWHIVKGAQSHALEAAKAGAVTASVDSAARWFLNLTGNAQYLTHRLGHGIGLEGHESPYLRGGSEDIIQTGHTFSDEPGIYIEGEIGIRLEDCFYIAEDGHAVYLTEGVGGQAEDPWNP